MMSGLAIIIIEYRKIIEQRCESLRILCKKAFIHTDEKLVILLGELEELEWQIVLFIETHAADHSRESHGGHKLITCLGITPYAGVGILAHSTLKAQLLGFTM